MIGRRAAIVLVLLLVLVVVLVVANPRASERSRKDELAPVSVRLVDGHGVKWWARRARSNGSAMRWQRHQAVLLRRAIADRVELSGDLAEAFVCIYHHEAADAGGWQANTGNGYFGGLQMDQSFMAAYGSEFLNSYGTADRWPPFVQVAVAMRAYWSGRGFGPWPNTRRLCGL